jgi:hypothetical protein
MDREADMKPKVEIKIEKRTAAEPLKTFKPAAAHQRPQPGPPASHFAGYPGNVLLILRRILNTGWGSGSKNGYNAGYADYPRPTTPAPGKGASASQYMEWLHSAKGTQGK